VFDFSIYAHDKEQDDIERHLAAIQIQEVFRRRMRANAAKQAEHQTRLPRPYVQQVFCGHRNSRTMVNINMRDFVVPVFTFPAADLFAFDFLYFILFFSAVTNCVNWESL